MMKPDEPSSNSHCVAWRTSAQSNGWLSLRCDDNQLFVCKQMADSCPPYYNNGTNGTIMSTNYPNEYENNLQCFYLVNIFQKFCKISILDYSTNKYASKSDV